MSTDLRAERPWTSLRAAAVFCLAIWAALWFLFLSIRFSSFDIRVIPGIGPVMLLALVVTLLAPLVALGLTAVALLNRPRVPLNWLALGGAVTALIGQVVLFTITRWQ